MTKPRLPAGRGARRLVRLIALTVTLAVALVLAAGAATRAAATSSTSGRGVLSVLLDAIRRRSVLVAGRRRFHPGHRQ